MRRETYFSNPPGAAPGKTVSAKPSQSANTSTWLANFFIIAGIVKILSTLSQYLSFSHQCIWY
jgi:hypothetical protein